MTQNIRTLLLWSPRVLGVLVSIFLGMFALDALGEGPLALLLHLSPALVLLLVVALSWRREWIGGALFTFLALLYTVTTLSRPDWILSIAGPLYLVGLLFWCSWFLRGGRVKREE